ncbi:AraC family transcriptional regulator [Aquitalea aquatica]|uniref:AraC family transcriptional regulator n=1 Tax=Aquitalea aquatica TaxID=3044273 RepID=A0A838Y161_9NEIS|nr:AraC family transcriptional regulator [Aquitalea magnusonii]MBA4708386.1 AraC family transcriptional regulator [Aquitalea magnusonii]
MANREETRLAQSSSKDSAVLPGGNNPSGRPVSLHAIVATVNVLAEQGIAAADLLAGSGIPPERLQEPARLINHHQEMTVFDNARRLSCDEALGLRLGRAMHTSNYGILGYTMLVSPTLRVALETAIRFPLLLASYFTLRLEERGKEAWLLADDYHYRADLLSFNAEMCLSSMWTIAGDCMGVRWSPKAVHMSFPLPAHAGFYPAIFGHAGHFDMADNALVFPAKWLDRPQPLADAVSFHMALEQCQRQQEQWASSHGSALVARVLRLIQSDPVRFARLDELTTTLHMSERTLRRKLAALGTSFQALLDQARHQQSLHLLHDTRLSIGMIAERLGFAESASFRHAFARWTGKRPSDLRR